MKATIEIEQDQIDSIVRAELSEMMDCLQKDLNRVKEHRRGFVFEDTAEEDIKEIKKHIKSFKRVLKYYGEDL